MVALGHGRWAFLVAFTRGRVAGDVLCFWAASAFWGLALLEIGGYCGLLAGGPFFFFSAAADGGWRMAAKVGVFDLISERGDGRGTK